MELVQPGKELAAEQLAQHAHWQEECGTRGDPAARVPRYAATRHDHVDAMLGRHLVGP